MSANARELKKKMMFTFSIFLGYDMCMCISHMQLLQEELLDTFSFCFLFLLYFVRHCEHFHYKLHTQEHAEYLREGAAQSFSNLIPSVTHRK